MLTSAATAKHFDLAIAPVPACTDPLCFAVLHGGCDHAADLADAQRNAPALPALSDDEIAAIGAALEAGEVR